MYGDKRREKLFGKYWILFFVLLMLKYYRLPGTFWAYIIIILSLQDAAEFASRFPFGYQ